MQNQKYAKHTVDSVNEILGDSGAVISTNATTERIIGETVVTFSCNICEGEHETKFKIIQQRKNRGSTFCMKNSENTKEKQDYNLIILAPIFLEHYAIIISDSSQSEQDKIQTRDNVKFECKNCDKICHSVKLMTLLRKRKDGLKYFCSDCQKLYGNTEKSMQYKYEKIKNELKQRGSTLLSPIEEFKGKKSPLWWICIRCKEKHCSLYESFSKTLLCHKCGIRKKSEEDGYTFESFREILISAGYQVLSDASEYENTKSDIRVICTHGNQDTTTRNNFTQGHRCMCSMAESKRTPIEQVRKLFIDKGHTPIFETYIHNQQELKYICGLCNEEASITYCNLQKQKIGCMKCAVKAKRLSEEYLNYIFEKAGCKLLDDAKDYLRNSQPLNFLCSCGNKDSVSIKSFRKGARCEKCNKKKRMQTCITIYGYPNPAQSEIVKERIKKYYRKNFGVEHNSQIPEVVMKREATHTKRTGVKCALMLEDVRQKGEEELMRKYGTKYPLELKEFQEKSQNTCIKIYGGKTFIVSKAGKMYNLEKYGSEYYINSASFRQYILEKYGSEYYVESETSKKLMLEKYGSEYYINSASFREFMLDTYGFEHAAQCPEMFSKIMRTSFSTKPYIFPSGEIKFVMGYEHHELDRLLGKVRYTSNLFRPALKEHEIQVEAENMPYIKYKKPGCNNFSRYFPDIYIPSRNTLIEVKSIYTYFKDRDINEQKWLAACKEYTLYVRVYNKTKGGVRIYRQLKYVDGYICQIKRYTN